MAIRSSTISTMMNLAYTPTGEDIYDAIKLVADNIESVNAVAAGDLQALITAWDEAKDFTGITVASGTEAGWDSVNRVLTVPTVKGDTGADGERGLDGPEGSRGPMGWTGPQGLPGDGLTMDSVTVVGNGTFIWNFSDGTSFTTPDLRGGKGATGKQGTSVDHVKGTVTTDPHGNFGMFGELDTYTLYGDVDEEINLGDFIVGNGITPDMAEPLGLMRRTAYDVDGTGIVDNSERLGGKDLATIETERDQAILEADLGLGTNYTVVDNTARLALEDLTVGDKVFVTDDGDGKWAQYWVTAITDGQGSTSTFEVVMDEDTYLNANTAASVKSTYESNPDTNAYTDAEKTKVGFVNVTQTVDLDTIEADTALNNTHRTSDGSDHTFIDQSVTTISTPTFAGVITGGLVDGRDVSIDGAKLDTIEPNARDDQIASEVPYTNTTSGLLATDVQGAVDEVEGRVDTAESKLAGIQAGAQVNTVTSVSGRTGAVTLAKGDVGLSNVDNTSDINKPLSTATSSALSGKVDKVTGKGLSDTNYTQAEKTKLDGIATGATKNATDAQLINRTTHTGVQPISSVTGLQTGLDNKADTSYVNTQLDSKADKTVSVVAGTGLSGGGTLAANRTLNVSYGTTAGTAAQGNDSRITGALQKSQVVQATGTSTTNVMSQKAITDALEALTIEDIYVIKEW